MSGGVIDFLKKALGAEPKLNPVDRGLAKQWIKKRLIVVFPELRNDPKALEQAYRQLSLEPREGTEEGDAETVFEMSLPERS